MKPATSGRTKGPCASPSQERTDNTLRSDSHDQLTLLNHTTADSATDIPRDSILLHQQHKPSNNHHIQYDRQHHHRQHALLRPCNPHLHPHRPLLRLRARLPTLPAHRLRQMGPEEKVPIRSDLLALHAHADGEIRLQYVAPPIPSFPKAN